MTPLGGVDDRMLEADLGPFSVAWGALVEKRETALEMGEDFIVEIKIHKG